MNIYLSHSSKFDYKSLLYTPLKSSPLSKSFNFILPHDNDIRESYATRALFDSGSCNLVLADVSFPSTGQGMELAWAESRHIPIICIYKEGSDLSNSLKLLTNTFVEYKDANDMVEKIGSCLLQIGS